MAVSQLREAFWACNVALNDELCVKYARSRNVAFIPSGLGSISASTGSLREQMGTVYQSFTAFQYWYFFSSPTDTPDQIYWEKKT